MRCVLSLALALLTLEVALALAPDFILPGKAMCPEASSSEEAPCAERSCLNDEECGGNTLCCPSACGRSCRTPIIVPNVKAGDCPRVQAPLLPQPCEEKGECSVDSQCRDNKKCCFSRCAMKCLDPILENTLQ
ncbi:whey acidic protein-like [Nycticebus coucang]|uniref:whey acidic protein-like n=1 Tax=Nycticebus coucang TaxID=9470 RepID=UPI00234D8683|nr:whey acidic protein-like [Nycticebus coucang]